MSYINGSSGRIRGERGSALILALMVMLILTFLGLTLLAMTETEMQLGGNERIQSELFYAAESGTAIAKARVLDGAVVPSSFIIPITSNVTGTGLSSLTGFHIGYRVGLSRTVAIRFGPCDFCPANEDDESWSFRVTYLVNSTGTRRDWRSADTDAGAAVESSAVQGKKTIGVTFDIEPSEMPLIEALATNIEEAEGISEQRRANRIGT
ncbi:MAG: hypothetical protein GY856_54305 [bacterium]|nr:hypothetical protein [bacterium]